MSVKNQRCMWVLLISVIIVLILTNIGIFLNTQPECTEIYLGNQEKVFVRAIPDDKVKTYKKESQNEPPYGKTAIEMIPISLTPPIIALWTHQLALALSEGNTFLL